MRLPGVPQVARSGVRAARATVVEVAWIGTHVALYPMGLVAERRRGERDGYRLDDLRPVHRGLIVGDVEAAGTPILLVHGVVDNRSVFAVLRRGLRRRGFGRVIALNYSPLTEDVREVAARIGTPPRPSAWTPGTTASTWSATPWAGWPRATTCSAWAGTPACTRL